MQDYLSLASLRRNATLSFSVSSSSSRVRTRLPSPSRPPVPPSDPAEFLWEVSDIHICLLLHQKFQARPAQPTSSLSYKGFAATYDISLLSYSSHLALRLLLVASFPCHTPPCPSHPLAPLSLVLHPTSHPSASPVFCSAFLLTAIRAPSSTSESLSSRSLFFPTSLHPQASLLPRRPSPFPSGRLFPSFPTFSRRSGLTSRPFFRRPLRTARTQAIRPVRDSPRNEPLDIDMCYERSLLCLFHFFPISSFPSSPSFPFYPFYFSFASSYFL